MLLHVGLVDEQRCRSILLAGDFFPVFRLGFCLSRRCRGSDSEFHESLHADVFLSRNAEDRHQLAIADSDAHPFPDLIFSQGTSIEKFLHESVIELSSLLDKLLAEIVRLSLKFSRNVKIFPGTVIVGDVHLYFTRKRARRHIAVHLVGFHAHQHGFLSAYIQLHTRCVGAEVATIDDNLILIASLLRNETAHHHILRRIKRRTIVRCGVIIRTSQNKTC